MDLNVRLFSKSEWSGLIDELSLAPRQAEVIEHLLYGLSDKQIAAELCISVPTVRTYLRRLFSKFNVQDRIELILYVMHHFRRGCGSKSCPRRARHHK